ncbi:VOC family protein [Thermoflavimicrobium daqui]|uniref:Glyoxalase n=1 Tax=Thermoflavimicrobium daqui TaxID=2137476 RepID=A0A364K1I3_9BACL|nr:VOC family protein [Thermoflavimicrobium daqui]RAL21898.1 glyoxalase [Thermoflavimicrobium daqui]
MNILDLHHAQITIPIGEESKARAFYCELLGIPEIMKPASLQERGGFWLQVGSKEVHVGTEDHAHRHTTKAHIAYLVDDCSSWRKVLTDHGIKVLESVPIPGYDRFEFRDPFGNRVELIQKI